MVIDFLGLLGGGGGGEYTLPKASKTTLGGIKVGDNLEIDNNGVLSAINGGSGDGAPQKISGGKRTQATADYNYCTWQVDAGADMPRCVVRYRAIDGFECQHHFMSSYPPSWENIELRVNLNDNDTFYTLQGAKGKTYEFFGGQVKIAVSADGMQFTMYVMKDTSFWIDENALYMTKIDSGEVSLNYEKIEVDENADVNIFNIIEISKEVIDYIYANGTEFYHQFGKPIIYFKTPDYDGRLVYNKNQSQGGDLFSVKVMKNDVFEYYLICLDKNGGLYGGQYYWSWLDRSGKYDVPAPSSYDDLQVSSMLKLFKSGEQGEGLEAGGIITSATGEGVDVWSNHAWRLGGNFRDHMDFMEYGADFRFYKSQGEEQTMIFQIKEDGLYFGGRKIRLEFED